MGTVAALKDLMTNGNALVIDVREAKDYAAGHMHGSIDIPIRTLAQHLGQIPKDRPVVVSCASGLRATQGMAALQLLGYSNARTFPPTSRVGPPRTSPWRSSLARAAQH